MYVRTFNWTLPWKEGKGPGQLLSASMESNFQALQVAKKTNGCGNTLEKLPFGN